MYVFKKIQTYANHSFLLKPSKPWTVLLHSTINKRLYNFTLRYNKQMYSLNLPFKTASISFCIFRISTANINFYWFNWQRSKIIVSLYISIISFVLYIFFFALTLSDLFYYIPLSTHIRPCLSVWRKTFHKVDI